MSSTTNNEVAASSSEETKLLSSCSNKVVNNNNNMTRNHNQNRYLQHQISSMSDPGNTGNNEQQQEEEEEQQQQQQDEPQQSSSSSAAASAAVENHSPSTATNTSCILPVGGGVHTAATVTDDDDDDDNNDDNSNVTTKISNDHLKRLLHNCKIKLDIHLINSDVEESYKQAINELMKKKQQQQQQQQMKRKDNDGDFLFSKMTEDEIVSLAIQRSRICQFPFTKFQRCDSNSNNKQQTQPTPLDGLVMDHGLLSVVQQVFNFLHNNNNNDNNNNEIMYPRLVEAKVIDMNATNENDDKNEDTDENLESMYKTFIQKHYSYNKEQQKDDHENMYYYLLKVTIPLSHHDRMKYTEIYMKLFQIRSGSNTTNNNNNNKNEQQEEQVIVSTTQTRNNKIQQDIKVVDNHHDGISNNNNNKIQPALQILFRYNCNKNNDILEGYDDISIRYLEHSHQSWICHMTMLQKCALGYPLPSSFYWIQQEQQQDENTGAISTALQQLQRRYYGSVITNIISQSNDQVNESTNSDNVETDETKMKKKTPYPPLPPPIVNGSKYVHPDETYKESCRFIEPEKLHFDKNDDSTTQQRIVLTQKQIKQFQNDGYLFVEGIFPTNILKDGIDASYDLWPSERNTNSNNHTTTVRDFAYPFNDERLNRITLEPNLWSVMKQLVGDDNIVLMQSACFAKRGSSSTNTTTATKEIDTTSSTGTEQDETTITTDINQTQSQILSQQYYQPTHVGNQPMHWDFGSNTLLTPSRCPNHWSTQVEEVQGILYYDNYNDVGGATAFVPGLNHTNQNPFYNGWLPDNDNDYLINSKQEDPRPLLYQHEQLTKFTKGSMLLFQLGTWHRGTPVFSSDKLRHVHHLSFRRKSCTWLGTSNAFGQPTVRSSLSNKKY